jgi:hypothetical protein
MNGEISGLSEDLESIARLAALEYVLTQAVKILFLSMGLGPEDLDELRKRIHETLAKQTFPDLPPPISDQFAAELAREVDRILADVRLDLESTLC